MSCCEAVREVRRLSVSLCKASLLLRRTALFSMQLRDAQTQHFPYIVHRPHLVQDRQDVEQLCVILFINECSNRYRALRLQACNAASIAPAHVSRVDDHDSKQVRTPEKRRSAESCPQ